MSASISSSDIERNHTSAQETDTFINAVVECGSFGGNAVFDVKQVMIVTYPSRKQPAHTHCGTRAGSHVPPKNVTY
jgi:hypothetical protein